MCKDKQNSAAEPDSQKSYWHIPTITAILIVLFALLIIAIVYLIGVAKIPVKVTDEGLVITFLGVIATFVVVGNFMQTAEIKRETIEKLQENKTELNTKVTELRQGIETDINAKIKEINKTITTQNSQVEEQIKAVKKDITINKGTIDDHFSEVTKALEEQKDTFTVALLANDQQQQSRIVTTKDELETRMSGLANMQADATSVSTRTMLDFVSLVIMMNAAQKKLFQEFLKRLPIYEICYKGNIKISADLRDNGSGFIRLYDVHHRVFLEEGDLKKVETICAAKIKGTQIEDVLNIYDLYNKILAVTMAGTKISGEKISTEGSYEGKKQEQGDKDNEGNFQA